jgi:hypothetical protein
MPRVSGLELIDQLLINHIETSVLLMTGGSTEVPVHLLPRIIFKPLLPKALLTFVQAELTRLRNLENGAR